MPGLGETVNALARLSKAAKRPRSAHGSSPLVETLAFGPNPGALRMLHYAPADLEPGAPLVVVLHGCTQTAGAYAAGAGWLTLADRYEFAVLAPEQRSSNNQNVCFNWFEPGDIARGQGEAASIRQMIAHLTDTLGLDASRVYVTGLSAGGAMTNVMLATYPEVFAGGAVIAGLPYRTAEGVQNAFGAMFNPSAQDETALGDLVRSASAHKGPWPRVSVWHGTSDSTVKSTNGDSVARQWAAVHGLAAPISDRIGGHRRLRWMGADGAPAVEQIIVDGMNHGTPIACGGEEGCGVAGPFLIEVGVSSSLEIARFWGIASGAARPSAPRPVREEEPLTVSAPYSASPSSGFDVQAVITKALTAAGLMK